MRYIFLNIPSISPDMTITKNFLGAITKQVKIDIASVFGGGTINPGQGFWIDDKNKLVEEDVQVIWSAIPDTVDNDTAEATMIAIARKLRLDLSQDAVFWGASFLKEAQFESGAVASSKPAVNLEIPYLGSFAK